jgi:hypothetical protein
VAHAGSLSAAAATADLGQIHTHMANGGFIDERDTHLNTPLHHACLAGHRAAVELLLSYGADVNAENMQGKSTLQFAGHSGDRLILRRLLEAGADPNHQSHDGKTALVSSIVNDFPDAARIIIEAGCNVDLPENDGNTPLHKAVQKDFPVCVQLLRSYGANQWVRNDAGKTPVDIARENGLTDVLDALLNAPLPVAHWAILDTEEYVGQASYGAAHSDAVTQVQRPSASASKPTATAATLAATAAAASAASAAPPSAAHQSQFALARKDNAPEQTALEKTLAQPGVPHRTLFDFVGTRPDELTFTANKPILVLKRFDDGWCLGEHNDLLGMFPAKYAVLDTRPRQSQTQLVVGSKAASAPSAAASPPPPAAAPAAPAAAQAAPAAAAPPSAMTAMEAMSGTSFASSDTRVVAGHKLVRESEAAVMHMFAAFEKLRQHEVTAFLDSVPTMAAASARAYDTSLRSVQLLAKLALAIDNVTPTVHQVCEANKLHDSMLLVTSSWIQTRQSLVDDGKNMREAVSVPVKTQLAEMTRTGTAARRAMAVYARLLRDKVDQLESAVKGGESEATATAAEGLERAVKFVTERHYQIKESLHWRLGSTLAALLNGWRALAEVEFHLQTRAVKSSERMQSALDAIDVPDTVLPDCEWESDVVDT